jgi:putative ABC transport system permease protein
MQRQRFFQGLWLRENPRPTKKRLTMATTHSSLVSAFMRKRSQSDFADELEAHLGLEADRLRQAGMSEEDAMAAARRNLGNMTHIQERFYEAHRRLWLGDLLQDLRFALRTMLRDPSFAVMAILILALGIGSNTSIFSLMYGILLRPLPFPHSDRLYVAWEEQQQANLSHIKMSGPDLADIEDQSRLFEYVAGMLPDFTYTLTGEGEPQILDCTAISPGFFPLLGIRPILGRAYRPQEYHVDGQWVIISYEFWQRQFHGDRHVIGHVLHLQNQAMTAKKQEITTLQYRVSRLWRLCGLCSTMPRR